MARYERAPRHVVAARYAGDYQVWLQFNDGRKGLVDLADELYGAIFEPLRDRERFAQLYLDCELADDCVGARRRFRIRIPLRKARYRALNLRSGERDNESRPTMSTTK